MENKRATEGRIIELQSDNQQQATHIKDLEDQLGELPQQLCELREQLAAAEKNQEANNMEMRQQLEDAHRKISNYKGKLLEKVELIRKLEVELTQARTEQPNLLDHDSLAESFTSIQKENIELLQKLQKAEMELQR